MNSFYSMHYFLFENDLCPFCQGLVLFKKYQLMTFYWNLYPIFEDNLCTCWLLNRRRNNQRLSLVEEAVVEEASYENEREDIKNNFQYDALENDFLIENQSPQRLIQPPKKQSIIANNNILNSQPSKNNIYPKQPSKNLINAELPPDEDFYNDQASNKGSKNNIPPKHSAKNSNPKQQPSNNSQSNQQANKNLSNNNISSSSVPSDNNPNNNPDFGFGPFKDKDGTAYVTFDDLAIFSGEIGSLYNQGNEQLRKNFAEEQEKLRKGFAEEQEKLRKGFAEEHKKLNNDLTDLGKKMGEGFNNIMKMLTGKKVDDKQDNE
jgi:hypothetical protein